MISRLIVILGAAERAVYVIAAGALIVAAGGMFVVLFADIVAGATGDLTETVVAVLDRMLLAFILLELAHSIQILLRERTLAAGPFLLIGLIAVVRHILILTARAEQIPLEGPQIRNLVLQLAVLTALVVALAGALYFLEPMLRRPIGESIDDLGEPVAHRAVREGVPVFDRTGRRVGVVDRVMVDEATDTFEGIIVHTLPLPGRHLYAGHEQITELRERAVLLSVEAGELQELSERYGRKREAGDDSPEHPLERRLRRAWDRITGVH